MLLVVLEGSLNEETLREKLKTAELELQTYKQEANIAAADNSTSIIGAATKECETR